MKKVASLVFNNFKNDARVLKEATTLVNNNYDVHVVALHEKGLLLKEDINTIKVERISLITRKLPKLFLIQLFKYLELTLKVICKYKNVDIIHCNDLAPLPIAVIIKLFINRKVKIVYDAHEYQTERNGLRGFKKRLSEITEKIFIKKVDHVITVSEGIAEEYRLKYGIKKPTLVYNSPFAVNLERTNIFRERFKLAEDQTIYLYQGGLYKGRGLEIALESFKQLSNKSILVVIGFGELEGLVKGYAKNSDNIFFHEAVSPMELLNYTASADVGLAIIENTSLSYYYSMPNKFFEYSMVGVPVIANNLYELKRLINQYDNGWIINELSTDSLIQAILKIEEIRNELEFKKKQKNAKKLSVDFNWENQEEKLLDAYKSLY